MTRILLLAILALVVWRLIRRSLAVPEPEARATRNRADALSEMVQDPVCGVFVATAQALTTVAGGRTHYFCSSACYRAFLGGARAARG